nr:hypothetical protein [Tanacetum cinerariifolium]
MAGKARWNEVQLITILLTHLTSSTSLLQRIVSLLHAEFAMTNLGPFNYFLGISATRTTSGIFLSRTKYATEILEQAQMLNCNLCWTPIDTEKKIGPEGSPVFRSTTSQLIAYSDADWAGCLVTRRSTSGYCVFLGDNLLTWSSKRQDTLSLSSAEAEYRGVANAVAETSWILNLLRELDTSLFTATLIFYEMVELGEVTAEIAAAVFVVVSGFLASATFAVAVVHVETVYAIWPIANPFLTIRLVHLWWDFLKV